MASENDPGSAPASVQPVADETVFSSDFPPLPKRAELFNGCFAYTADNMLKYAQGYGEKMRRDRDEWRALAEDRGRSLLEVRALGVIDPTPAESGERTFCGGSTAFDPTRSEEWKNGWWCGHAQGFGGAAPAPQAPTCSPTLTECPRCKNDITKCDGVFAASQAAAAEEPWRVLDGRSTTAYTRYIDQMRRDECLGWEHKVKHGKFGEAELKAHCTAAEYLGMHRAYADASKLAHDTLAATLMANGPAETREVCRECGATSEKEAEMKCLGQAASSVDDCHGCSLWNDSGRASASVATAEPVKLTPKKIEELAEASGADIPAMTAKDWRGMRRFARLIEAALTNQAAASVAGLAGAETQQFAERVRDGIADFVGDNWPMRKHGLAEIEAGIRAIEIDASRLAAQAASTRAGEPKP